jgi:hypothetical protein
MLLCGCDAKSPLDESAANPKFLTAKVGSLVTNNEECGDSAVFRFDAVSPDGSDNRRIFVDFQNARSGIVTRGSPDTESLQGGHVYSCSTAEARCVDAGLLAFAWPKNENETHFALMDAQCRLARAGEVSIVSCFMGQEMVYRYRVSGRAIDRVELFYPGNPDYSEAVFEAVDYPLPLCKL